MKYIKKMTDIEIEEIEKKLVKQSLLAGQASDIQKKNENLNNEENLFIDFEEYKHKYLENRKAKIESFIYDEKISDKEKIIKFLESELYFLEEQQKAIFYSNEEMMKYSTDDDKDIQEYRAENMKLMFKNFERMKKIKDDILGLDKTHYIKDKNFLSIFSRKQAELQSISSISISTLESNTTNNPFIVEFIDRSDQKENINTTDSVLSEDEFNNLINANNNSLENNSGDNIIKEIEL